MNAKNTPGPWDVCSLGTGGGDNWPIMTSVSDTMPETLRNRAYIGLVQGAANARLIAAAPDLLVAGQLVLNSWERGDLAAAVRELSAAIAKARGES